MGWPKMSSDEYKPRMVAIAEAQQETIKMLSERVSLIGDILSQIQARVEAIYAERIERGDIEIAAPAATEDSGEKDWGLDGLIDAGHEIAAAAAAALATPEYMRDDFVAPGESETTAEKVARIYGGT